MRRRKRVRGGEDEDEEDVVVLETHADTIFYRGEIREPHATKFCIALMQLAASYPLVRVMLTSFGGDVMAGLNMYEAIRRCKVDVHVYADGCVCSSATFVLLAAQKRYMYSTSVLLIHALTTWHEGGHKPSDLKDALENSETLLDIMSAIYLKHSNLKVPRLKKMYTCDTYMRAEECKQMALIDEIIS